MEQLVHDKTRLGNQGFTVVHETPHDHFFDLEANGQNAHENRGNFEYVTSLKKVK